MPHFRSRDRSANRWNRPLPRAPTGRRWDQGDNVSLKDLFKPPAPPPEPGHDAEGWAIPYGLQHLHAMQLAMPEQRRRLIVGADDVGLIHTGEDENLGIAG